MLIDHEREFALSDTLRRLANFIRIGTIKKVDYSKSKARVEIGDLCTDWLPWIAERAGDNATWHPLDVGEQVIVLSPSGDLSQGVILPALYKGDAISSSSDIHKLLYKDGSSIAFDRGSGVLTIDVKGDVIVKASGSVTVDASSISLAGDKAIARVGDPVAVDSVTHRGSITGGSDKVTAG